MANNTNAVDMHTSFADVQLVNFMHKLGFELTHHEGIADWFHKNEGTCELTVDGALELKAAVDTLTHKAEKAYGGCHLCYGKGYSTFKSQIIGYGTDGDIGGFQGKFKDDLPVQMKYCNCDRGKQLQDLLKEKK